MKPRFLGAMWRDLSHDTEALCALSLSNLGALLMLMLLELWLRYGGR